MKYMERLFIGVKKKTCLERVSESTTQFLSKQSLEEGKRGLELYRPSCHSTS